MILAVHPLIFNLWPEILLLVGAAMVLLFGLYRSSATSCLLLSLAFVVAAAIATLFPVRAGLPGNAISEIACGPLVPFVRLATLGIGALILLACRHVPADGEQGDFFALALVSFSGIPLVALANNLVLLFLALELVSIPTYILIALSRRDLQAQEATGKYFFLGAFAAAITLYGFSFLYGAAGTMQLGSGPLSAHSLHDVLSRSGAMGDTYVVLGLVLVLAGLAFKIAAVPLHFYVADVYQGAAAPVAGLLGFVPKFAGFLALMKILGLLDWSFATLDAQPGGNALFWLLWVLAAVTMTTGNTLALSQYNIKRLLAYSSIAHSGYMLVALLVGLGISSGRPAGMSSGLAALLFYIVVYGMMNLGAFAAVSFFRRPGRDDADDSAETLDDLAGAARRHPWAAMALSVCVLGLMGFPLTGGFLGKFYVFTSALASGDSTDVSAAARQQAMIALVVIGVLNSAVAAVYYLRILAACYLRRPSDDIQPNRCPALPLAMTLCAAFILAIFLKPDPLFRRAVAAAAPPAAHPSPSHGTEAP